ncbi:hypothetical protein [Streptomyces antimicrobicus]|uniref:DUF732 domain-containing protein n=1 Tax=Streptomyces antimicrobicus TaxID=2883108 RepID=A0ABS8BAN9_9ACTN|nr:hypothetical protein [Streptomyces antimicrobicus]MCB5181606.1 hypothetical protein [Streptomyces antimicrobicus]
MQQPFRRITTRLRSRHRAARLFSATLLTAVSAAALAACGTDTPPAPPKGPSTASAGAPTASTAPTPASPTPPSTSANGIPPKPDAATEARYLRALDAISPDIVAGKTDRAVSRGRDTCGTIHSFPQDRAKQVDITRQRFSGAQQLTSAQAEQILGVVKAHLCPAA